MMRRLKDRNIYIIDLWHCVQTAGGADAFVEQCAASRFSAIWARLGYGHSLDPNFKSASIADLSGKLSDAGVALWGWHLPRCQTPAAAADEAQRVGAWAKQFALAGVLLDAERGSAYFLGGANEAGVYARGVRQALGDSGLALSSHDQPHNFPGFPFGVFLAEVADNAPQVYYTRSVQARLDASIADYKKIDAGGEFDDRYKPVGNITIHGDVALPDAQACVTEAAQFIGLVAQRRFGAYSFWCWDDAPQEIWAFFKNTPVWPAELAADGSQTSPSRSTAARRKRRIR
jgi:hypothetical protein